MFTLLATLALPAIALAQVNPSTGQTYTISPSNFPNLCLAPAGDYDGAQIVTKDCDTADDIVWTYQNDNLVNTATNKCLDVTNGGNWNGNQMQVWDCFSNNRNQVWLTTGTTIKWSGRNFCLDLTNGNGNVGTPIQIWNCFNGNTNQVWDFVDAEEVDSCDTAVTNSLTLAPATSTSAAAAQNTTAATSTADAQNATASGTDAQTTSSTAVIGGDLLAGGGHHTTPTHSTTSAPAATQSTTSGSLTASLTGSLTVSGSFTASVTTTIGAGATGSSAPVVTGKADYSGYQQTSGTQIVDASGNNVIWKGINLGGWLVSEDWMNGITDYSGNADRFAMETLESRFGASQTETLFNAWYDNWLQSSDWDMIAAMGYNSVRLPFSWRNLQWADGSWKLNSNGDIDFTRLDWAVAQAKQRNIVIILVFHIWDTQQQQYSMISENTADGQSSRDRAGKIWKEVSQHYLGEPTIAAYDAINEPTGSWGDLLQQDLYTAIRSVDPKRIIVMESISTNPANYGWTNVVYSWHEYNCMGSDFGSNKATLASGLIPAINLWQSYNIPAYLGEFMADGQTLDYILQQMNNMGISWQSWTWKTVNMGRWGLYNLGTNGGMQVTVSSDSYSSILNTWSNMGSLQQQAVTSQYASVMGVSAPNARKRDLSPSPRAGTTKEFKPQGRRSRSHMARAAHGKLAGVF